MTYMTHPYTTVPGPDAVVWRYLDLGKFMSMLESTSLWFSSIAALAKDDQWEGLFHRSLREMWNKHTGLIDDLGDLRQLIREQACANCWHINEIESDAMWKLYSKGGRDLVIRSTFGRLCKAINGCVEQVCAGEVEYIDHAHYDYKKRMVDEAAGTRVMNVTPVLIWKRPSYAHERELRLFHYASPPIDEECPGLSIPVDLALLFDEVRASPRSPEWFRVLVEQIMARYGFKDVPVKRSSMDDEPEP